MPKNNTYYKSIYCLSYAHPRYMKCLFANTQMQQNMLKYNLLFRKNTNFTDKHRDNAQDPECKIFMVLLLLEPAHVIKFSNLHQCTFKNTARQTYLKQHNIILNRMTVLSISSLSGLYREKKLAPNFFTSLYCLIIYKIVTYHMKINQWTGFFKIAKVFTFFEVPQNGKREIDWNFCPADIYLLKVSNSNTRTMV